MQKSRRTYKVVTFKEAVRQLELLRGRARQRILGQEDLLQALNEARRGAYGLRAGDTVAASYGYPARRMRLVTIRRRSGSYAVLANWGKALGQTACPLGGQPRKWERTLAEAKTRLIPPPPDATPWLIIPAREVHAALALWRIAARCDAEASWPLLDSALAAIPVTREDSLAAGNCPNETERVAKWWPAGTVSVPASELREKVLRREPTLARYAQGAVEVAVQRQGAAS